MILGSLLSSNSSGPANAPGQSSEGQKITMGGEMLKRVLMGGGYSAGVAIVLAGFEMLKTNPTEAFPLLRAWGPWSIVAVVAMYFFYDVTKDGLTIGKRLVLAVEQLAVAQQKSADKDDRQLQEMQTLTSLTAQRSEKTYAMLQSYHEATQMIMHSQQDTLSRLEKKVDALVEEQEKRRT